jgi:hypothetical protein
MSIKKARGGVILSHVDVFQMVDDWRQHRQFIPKPWKPASITLDLAMMRLAEQVRADGYGEGYARALMPSDTDGEE